MRRDRPFWKESDSSVMQEEPSAVRANEARGRQRVIGAALREWYDTIAKEPVPDEWLELLSQSDSGAQARENGQTENVGKVGMS